MKKLLNLSISLLFACILLFNFQSCALLGFGAGAIVDSNKPHAVPPKVNTESIQFLEKGTPLEVVNHHGFIYKGTFDHYGLEKVGTDTINVLVLISKNRPMRIASDNIKQVAIRGNNKNAKWVGLGVGAVIDAVIITVVAKDIRKTNDRWRRWWDQNHDSSVFW